MNISYMSYNKITFEALVILPSRCIAKRELLGFPLELKNKIYKILKFHVFDKHCKGSCELVPSTFQSHAIL